MNVHLEREWMRDGYRITFYERRNYGAQIDVLRFDGEARGGVRWDTQDAHTAVDEPSLFLPADALAALLQEAGKVLPATHATERHLEDAVTVRDRLLALVESGWTS